ncbi:tail fiber domain-containing protein, partial [Microcoleus sp. C2C6]
VPLAFRESDRAVTEGGLWRMPLDAGTLRFDVNTSASGNFSPSIQVLSMYPNGDLRGARDIYANRNVYANGNVGIGTTNPLQYGRLTIEDGAVPLAFRESDRAVTEGGLWRMPLDAGILRFDVNTSASGNFSPSIPVLSMYPNGDVRVAGDVYARNQILSSSRELKENIAELSGKEAVEALKNLNPVKFNFKADSDKNRHIGFIAEDVPELVATSDRKTLSPMDIVAVLTQALKEQQNTISALAEKVKLLEAKTA